MARPAVRVRSWRTFHLWALAVAATVVMTPPAVAGPPTPYVSFAPMAGSPLTAGGAPSAIIAADLDNDGFLDLATANRNGDSVTVAFGAGSAGFPTVFDVSLGFDLGAGAAGLTAGDFNEDGLLDLATANSNSNDVSVLLQQPARTFALASYSPLVFGADAPVAIEAGDLDGDGDADLVVASTGASGGQAGVAVQINNAPSFGHGPGSPFTVDTGFDDLVLADFDADGRLDLATTGVYVRRGLGSGGFGPSQRFLDDGHELAAGDIDGDGALDLVSNLQANGPRVLLGTGTGGFAGLPQQWTEGSGFGAVARFDPDPYADLLVTYPVSDQQGSAIDGRAELYVGGEHGFLSTILDGGWPVARRPEGVATGDFNRDGRTDFASIGRNINNGGLISVLLNTSPWPAVALDERRLEFPDTEVNTFSAPAALTVTNTGTAPLHVYDTDISGGDADDFLTSSDTCTGESIAPAATCVIRLRFGPAIARESAAELHLVDDAVTSPQDVTLGGVGTAPTGGGPPGPMGPMGPAGPDRGHRYRRSDRCRRPGWSRRFGRSPPEAERVRRARTERPVRWRRRPARPRRRARPGRPRREGDLQAIAPVAEAARHLHGALRGR